MPTVDAQHNISITVQEKLYKKNMKAWYQAVASASEAIRIDALEANHP